MKEIRILAYTNFNFGDDMFIYTLCKTFPNQKFVLKADKSYKKTFGKLLNLSIHRISLVEKMYNIIVGACPNLYKKNVNTFGYSAIVYVIGGLFDEDDIWKKLVNKYGLKRLKNIMWKNSYDSNVPFFLLGCNITRVSSEKYINQMNFLFEGLRDICFRDKYSYDYFQKLDNTRYAPDIVFNYKCNLKNEKDKILISVWGPLTHTKSFPQWEWAKKLWKPYEKFIIEIAKEFAKLGKKVTLLALCENEGDLYACNKIKDNGQLDVDIVTYNGNLEEIISLFEKAYFVVGTRFHSIVMALNAKCAFYPIVYESKSLQLLNDIKYSGNYSNIEDVTSYNVKNVLGNYKKNEVINCEGIKADASKQFKVLKDYLEL